MNGRILPFEPRGHDEALRLLPWLVNERLEPEARAWVEAHVAGCADCRRERVLLDAVHAACRQDDAEQDDADIDAGWRRVRARVQPRAVAPSRWNALRRGWARMPRWVGWTMAAQAALLVVAATVLFVVLPRTPSGQAPMYRTLGAATPGTLLVVVDPAMREAQWRGLLQASGARIVDGPNATGAYVLAVPGARAARACDALRAAPGILLVERIDGGGCAP